MDATRTGLMMLRFAALPKVEKTKRLPGFVGSDRATGAM